MTDVKRVLAQIADQVTDSLFKQAQVANHDQVAVTRIANETLIAIREQAQNMLGEIMEEEKRVEEFHVCGWAYRTDCPHCGPFSEEKLQERIASRQDEVK